ncbi:MAG: hypothetical protein E6J54_24860 [Deltaproteobacteria bacterium]|nr:MAG: hypothetical protein E6J54_24860 [Deltaproteobacteria bacterium]
MAKKKSHEEEIRRGAVALQQKGVAMDDVSPALVPRLKAEFRQGKEIDLAIIFALGKIVDPTAVEALAAIDKQTTDKEIKKEIKRSFFKLAQRGLAIPREESSEARSPTALFDRTPEIEAYMSSVDGAGGRLIWIAKPQPNHGLQVIQAMVNDREGLQRIVGAQIRRKELRKMAQEIEQQHGVAMILIPWEYADELVYEGFEKAKSHGRSGGLENFHEIRSVVSTARPKIQQHPIYSKLNSEVVREGAWRELSRRLLDEPEFRFWILDDDFAQSFLSQLQEAQTSRLVLNPMQKEERLASIVRDAVEALCAGEMGKLMQRRMEDMALYLFETGRAELAQLALAVALQIKEGAPGPLDVSFLTGLVQKSFAFHISQEKTKAEEETSLIVKP